MLFSCGCYKKTSNLVNLKIVSIAVNCLMKGFHANFRLSNASNLLLKPLYLTKVFSTFCSCQWLYFGTVDSFLSTCGTGTWSLIHFMVNFKEFYVISSSKIYLSKSVKIFYWIFGIKHSESHALSLVHNFAPDCKNTIF